MASDHFARSSRYENNRSSRKSPSHQKDRRKHNWTNADHDHHNERMQSLRTRKRAREHSPYCSPKRKRSRSVDSSRRKSPSRIVDYRDRKVDSSRAKNYDSHVDERGYLKRDRSRRCDNRIEDRDDYRGRTRRGRRDSPRDGSKYRESRRKRSRENERKADVWDGPLEDEYSSRRTERRVSEAREKSRNYKRSRSRSYRGNTKRNKRESKPVVEDDEEGHLIFSKGDIIQDRYKILSELGEGTFGKVVKCEDLSKKKTIAIKIIKNVKKYRDAAKLEINVLNKLANYDPDCRYKCVQMYDWFDYHGHKCIAFQLLGQSVFDFLKDNNYAAYPLEHVRSIAYELCLSVNFIHTHRLTHTDLKPENILFFDSNKVKKDKKTKKNILLNPEIRLIDFGSATFDHEHHSSIIQTRHYRAPEVILKLGWNQACDTWSIGCIIIELALGSMLFDTHSSIEHLAMMERILGKFPTDIASKSGSGYFKKGLLDWDPESKEGRYVRRKVKSLERYIPRDFRSNKDWIDMFDLIRKMLEYDPSKRIKLPQAMEHSFLEKIALRKPSRSSSGYESR